ncbi:PAS domain S-box protein [Tuwongella immobilis]|uniref:histidine kinase n=1 Tax=Tuwongella immobilis TaxID=692036 RepID=A0A6C2YWE9_9BACT|nr:PAS domain S-box protein [Tuwongella immobilis]VIP05721.1 pas domain s-box : PAS domain S-box OS=Microcoleus sp. PCC 7113 GN=Mic7113_3096 PE=4 SV=1: PAS_2: GAF: PHY: PAS_9: PAS_9: PAS: PAS_3: PAS_3: HisKA: HATPase_c: Response_reg [Tuwongella immobilis]VTS08798.1 pas domain s-box : PAS domain S-box OS=Microcoleus sp. PCC 7113 GN=Mic7113_3096 PE=4 SV=1: PAS_2: GAF: PHY: PAS_9: PAS_9: PAS: PAS_3: PAS_3: HisKA: HATPase_c: Response_reg [Tuwongella immobilis]
MTYDPGSILVSDEALAECAREAIHLPGAIQPHGVLLAFDAALRLGRWSAKAASLFGFVGKEFAGCQFADLFTDSTAAMLEQSSRELLVGGIEDWGEVTFRGGDSGPHVAFAHWSGGWLIVELIDPRCKRPLVGYPRHAEGITRLLQETAELLTANLSLETYCERILEKLRRRTGYDRLMVYRFCEDWHGEVIAESRDESATEEPYLGLHYPASDIPPQARELYRRNRVRVLVDVLAEQQPLLPPLAPGQSELDLSYALLRSFSPIHREYLTNMGVRSTLVVSILRHGQLWGLIACHHHEPYVASHAVRSLVVAMANLIEAQVELLDAHEKDQAFRRQQAMLARLPEQLDSDGGWLKSFSEMEAVLRETLAADGVAIVNGTEIATFGTTPNPNQMQQLVRWLEKQRESVVISSRFTLDWPEFAELRESASGLVALNIPHWERGWLLWFRCEQSVSVTWAGDPRKGLSLRNGKPRLAPRESFALWLEQIHGTSRPWTARDQEFIRETLRVRLLEARARGLRQHAETLRRFRGIVLEQITDAVVLTDLQHRITFWNDSAKRIYGWTSQQTLGRDFTLLHRLVQPQRLTEALKILTEQGRYQGEWQGYRADGTVIWVAIRWQMIHDDHGKPLGAVCIASDVTPRRATEEQLRLMQAVVESARDVILVTEAEPIDLPGPRILYVNPAFQHETGYSLEEVVGQTPRILQTPKTDRAELDRLRHALKNWQPVRVELLNRRKDGSEFWAELDITPLSDASGWCSHWIAVQRNITERKQAEVNLRASEARFRNIIRNSAIGMALVSPDGRFMQANPALCQILGYSESELVGKTVVELTHPDDFHLDWDQAKQLMAGKIDRYTQEKRYFHRDGRIVWGLLSVSGVRDEQGEFSYFISQIQDVTQQRWAAEELRLGEERLQLALTAGRMATFDWDIARNVLTWSRLHYELFGYTPEEIPQLRQEHFLARVHPDDRRIIDDRMHDMLTNRSPFAEEYRILHPSGEIRWALSIGRMFFDAHGSPVRMLGVVQDITARKQAESELKEANERYQLLAATIHDVVSLHDAQGRVLYASPSSINMSGYTPLEMLEIDYLQLVHPDDHGRVIEAHLRNQQNIPTLIEWRHRHRNGDFFWVETTAHPICDEHGKLTGIACSTRNIHRRRMLEDQMRQSQKLEAIGRLAGGVAHDFNNLLTVVNGCASLLLESLPAGHSERTIVEDILRAGERGAALTKQLLVFSRQKRAKSDVFDPNWIAQETIDLLTRVLGEQIQLVVDLAPQVGFVQADMSQFQQVLMNLIVNARDAMPKGGRLEVRSMRWQVTEENRTEPQVAFGPYIRITVTDSGVGMTEEVKTHLFEPFFTTKPVGKGTGLGLATVYGILQQSKGFIAIDSVVGEGTSFHVHFPAHPGPATQQRVVSQPTPTRRGNEVILLVEDEDAVRTLTRVLLVRAGYQVLEAESAEQALEIYPEHGSRIQLIVTDVVMPGMSGCELVTQLESRHPANRVLFLSGYTPSAPVREHLATHGSMFLQKPYSPELLVRMVREILDRSPTGM